MSSWTEPLSLDPTNFVVPEYSVDLTPYCSDGLFPTDGVIRCAENGSMMIKELRVFLTHQHRYVREHISDERIASRMDEHISRSSKKETWLREF